MLFEFQRVIPMGVSDFFSDDNNSFLLSFKNLNLSLNCRFFQDLCFDDPRHHLKYRFDILHQMRKYFEHSFSGPLELYMHTNTQKNLCPHEHASWIQVNILATPKGWTRPSEILHQGKCYFGH